MDIFKPNNKRCEVSRLFKLSLEKPKTVYQQTTNPIRYDYSSSRTSSVPYGGAQSVNIFFYEYSNLYMNPKHYTDIYSFISFCASRNIIIPPYVRDIIEKCGTCRVTEKKGTNELIVRYGWSNLKDALNDDLEF